MEKEGQVEKGTNSSWILFLQRNRKLLITILVVAGLSVAILIYAWSTLWKSDAHSIQYSPEDIVYGQPLQAVHDMSAIDTTLAPDAFTANAGQVPDIIISEYYYDFGDVVSTQVLSRTFVIANHGQAKLVIQKAYTTCGCTVADFSTTEIPPGKVALMTLQFDPAFHDLRGTTVRRGVIFFTNDPIHPIQEVWIQASVR